MTVRTHDEAAIAVTAAEADLDPWPLPADRILEGAPEASGMVFSRSEDARLLRGVWRCTPGRFTWQFTWDETLTVVEGDATVELDTGEVIELRPGVIAFFGCGHQSTWTVREPVLKTFHLDSPEPVDI